MNKSTRAHALIRTGLRACLALLAVVLLGATAHCGPRLPPAAGCTAGTYRCTDTGHPETCSSGQRWEPIGDSPCAAAGEVCVVERTAHCAPLQITAGGSDAR